jgi:hypothetical protein
MTAHPLTPRLPQIQSQSLLKLPILTISCEKLNAYGGVGVLSVVFILMSPKERKGHTPVATSYCFLRLSLSSPYIQRSYTQCHRASKKKPRLLLSITKQMEYKTQTLQLITREPSSHFHIKFAPLNSLS